MTRHLRDILFLLVAAIVIITLFWATTEQDEYVIKVPKYFRGQLVADTRFVGPQNERQRAVVAAFEHAWTGYRQFAWGHDNLKPNTKRASDWFGLGLTIVDSLSTMIIMNLKDHVEEARNWVETSFRTDVDEKVSLFEVSIRVLGGLLSAHYLSGDKVYLTKAVSNRIYKNKKNRQNYIYFGISIQFSKERNGRTAIAMLHIIAIGNSIPMDQFGKSRSS